MAYRLEVYNSYHHDWNPKSWSIKDVEVKDGVLFLAVSDSEVIIQPIDKTFRLLEIPDE